MSGNKTREQLERLKAYYGIMTGKEIISYGDLKLSEEEQSQVHMELLWNPENNS